MMLAMGRLAMDMLGVGTSIGGAACTPGTGLNVVVAPGGIYSYQNVDNNAYGSLGIDTAHQTIKQGSLFNAATLSCPAPSTPGQSINYLIEGQFQENDTNAVVVPYYNSANPTQPFQGPRNNGLSQNTLRQGLFVVQTKAGTPATTGSQVTPTVDAGWVVMYVVTVDFGETSLTTADIVVASGAPFIGVTALNALSRALADTLYLPLPAQTAAELAASVTPTNYIYPEMHPRRYGALGNTTTDDTAALNSWVAVVNAYPAANPNSPNPVSTWSEGLTYLCAPLNAILANNFTWRMNSTLLVKPNSWGAGPTMHIQVLGTGARIYGLIVNGNQANWSSAVAGYLLNMEGNDFLLDSVQTINSPSEGTMIDGILGGRFVDCHFDSNAYTGLDLRACSYFHLTNCTINFNGFGFQKTFATNAFQGFGLAQRFRNHHMTYVNCEARQNGRDGFNTDQGTYAVKYIGCMAWNNGDGGFTLAADNTSTGRPGEGESPYDIEYVDCESYNNWSSGIAAYAPVYNVTVDGGRYYNNNTTAGTIAGQSSFIAGLFFAGGSQGIRIRTKAYDDRQVCPVTAQAAGVVTATGWAPNTGVFYPRVALYNASMAFQGYGNITTDSAGSVTITTSAFNGVTIASIVAGWFISQRVQHNGCFFDNDVQGTQDIDGFGFLPGALGPTLSGSKSMSGFTASGQNVLLPAQTVDYTELLANPTWDATAGSGSSWVYSVTGGGAANFYTTAGANIRSPGALQLIGGSSAALGDAVLITGGLSYMQGAWIEGSVWCSAVNAGDAAFLLVWNVGGGTLTTVVNHPGGGYKQLKVGGYMPVGTTACSIRVQSSAGKTNYFDNASLRVKSDNYDNRDFAYPTRNLQV